MKTLLENLRRWLRPWPYESEPIAIRRAVLDDLELHTVALGGGTKLFPYDHLELVLRVSDLQEQQLLEKVIAEGWHLETGIRDRLLSLGCKPPARLRLERRFVLDGEEGHDDPRFAERRFFIVYGHEEAPESGRRQPGLQLRVLKGRAEKELYELGAPRVYLGRLPEVLDSRGNLERRNDVAFADEGEVNLSVSRRHATILYDTARHAYVLRDDESETGTRIFREGRPIQVSRHPGGVRLRDGDEVGLGQARVAVKLVEES